MFQKNILLSALCAFVFSVNAIAKVEPWSVDTAHSSARFEITHLVISTVDGSFKDIGGEVQFDPTAFTAGKDLGKMSFNLWANMGSITTANEKRDEHLKSADFFDASKKGNEKVTFVSTEIKKGKKGDFTLAGKLTLKGTTKPVTLQGVYKGTATLYGKNRVGFTLTGEIKRSDYGITWNDVVEAGPVVGDTVKITLNIEATSAAAGKT